MERTKVPIVNAPNLIELINALVDKYSFIILEQKNGKVYHLVNHHKYLQWRRHAPRELVGEGKIDGGDYVYLYNKIPTLTRKKF